MSRFLHRPMFRRGGSAGEGITSGLRRGYADGNSVPEVSHRGMPTFNEPSTRSDFNFFDIEERPELPKSSAAADFWLNLGTSILAQPGGRPILQTLGTAGQAPIARYQQQRSQEDLLKYKHAQGERQFQLEWYKALNDPEKLKVQREMEWYMSEAGGNMTKEEALDTVMRRKPMSKEDIERQAELKKQEGLTGELESLISGLGDKWTTLDLEDARRIKAAKDLARDMDLGFDLDAAIIIDRRLWKSMNFADAVQEDGSIGFHKDDYSKMDKAFQDGYVYVDIVSGNIYKKDGPKLIKIN